MQFRNRFVTTTEIETNVVHDAMLDVPGLEVGPVSHSGHGWGFGWQERAPMPMVVRVDMNKAMNRDLETAILDLRHGPNLDMMPPRDEVKWFTAGFTTAYHASTKELAAQEVINLVAAISPQGNIIPLED